MSLIFYPKSCAIEAVQYLGLSNDGHHLASYCPTWFNDLLLSGKLRKNKGMLTFHVDEDSSLLIQSKMWFVYDGKNVVVVFDEKFNELYAPEPEAIII